MERSSKTVLDDANMPRRTAGVTGILLEDWPGGGWFGLPAPKVEGVTVLVEDTFEWDDMMMGAVVGSLQPSQRSGSEGRADGFHPLHTMQPIILS